MTFQFYSDPGHGWLRVDLASAKAVGLEPKDFSGYSHAFGNWLYLEEDCDAGKFIVAYQCCIVLPHVIVSVHFPLAYAA